jgi:MOSC domain-containing protein
MTLAAINRFPVKSCRGHALPEALVEPWGLAGDRRWLVVDDDGTLLTARERPRMLLITTAVRADGGLDLTSPDAPDLTVDVPSGAELVPVRVWSSTLDAALAAPEASAWFSKIVGRPARLVYLDDPTRRHPNPAFALPNDYVSFADGYPLLLASTASLRQLNDWIAEGPRADEGPVPMIRFRPNVVIDGAEPWAEDGWRRLRIGAAVFRAVKGCDRCVMTTTDADTAARGKEPITTLAKHRRWDGATWFGMNLVPDTPGVTIAVGDEVEILHAEPAPDGPPR